MCYTRKPFYSEVLYVDYRVLDPGFGVRMADIFFFGLLFFVLLAVPWRKLVLLPYNLVPWIVLIVLFAASLALNQNWLLGSFTLHKLVRAGVLYWVIVNVVRDEHDVRAVLAGLLFSVFLQAYLVLLDKYVTGAVVHRSIGSFRHANSLAMYINLLAPIFFAVLLSGQLSFRWNLCLCLGILLSALCIFFTRSRAALALLPMATGGVAFLSLLFRPTWRKYYIIVSTAAALTVLFVIALPHIIERFKTAPAESLATRIDLNRAARAMASEHFFGVGPNQFLFALQTPQYYHYVAPEVLALTDPEVFRQSPLGVSLLGTVHNVYLLHAAEIGWIGMAIFIFFLARFFIRNIVLVAKSSGGSLQQPVLQGLLFGTIALHAQGLLEFALAQPEILFTFFLLMGLMVAMSRYETRRKKSNILTAVKSITGERP